MTTCGFNNNFFYYEHNEEVFPHPDTFIWILADPQENETEDPVPEE